MKVLIWIACCFVPSAIKTALEMSGTPIGLLLMLALYGPFFWLARRLCKKWDAKHSKIDETQQMSFCPVCGKSTVDDTGYCLKCGEYQVVAQEISTSDVKEENATKKMTENERKDKIC